MPIGGVLKNNREDKIMNERSMKKMLLVTIVLSVMVLAGFSALTGNAAAAAPKATSNQDTLIIAFQQDIPNLNWFDPATNTVWKSDAIGWGYDTLMSYTPDLVPYYNMAESVDVDSTGLNYTVHLRHGITFQDGVEMTAQDVVFTYDVLSFDSLFKTTLGCLYWDTPKWTLYDGSGTSHIGVEMVDKYTVAFHLAKPYPLFFQGTLNTPILPYHIWKDHVLSAGTGDSDDVGLDMSYGKDMSQKDATIGTGPYKFVEWKPGAYVVVERYDNYWGKNFTVKWQGKEWPAFPQNVKRIEFKIYNTLDTAVLALKKGEVDYIDWSVPAGYYNQLKTDPNIGSKVVDDQGFFYLAFNMRKAPMNDLAFRTAVAHCIDKDYIVTTLLQGYGTKGTVPLSITSGAYINTSAIPPDFDLNAATQVLDKAGYKDINGDGWREAPDGSPIKETILTPPKDYDPVRAEAGIMIQNNLQKVGLNIQSSPTDFDTIVSKAFVQVSFDMYILGWLVGSFPEMYLKDFFYSKYAAPIGDNAPGYSNPKVDKLLDEIDTQMDTQKRIQEIKDVEGILVHDLPYDVLYYRKNIMCYRQDVWQGWVSAFGTIYNAFSLAVLHHPGAGPAPTHGKTTTVSEKYNGAVLHVYAPPVVYAGHDLSGYAYVTDRNGVPIPGVDISLTTSTGYNYSAKTGDSGGFPFTIPISYKAYGNITLWYAGIVKIGGNEYNLSGSQQIAVYFPKNVVKVSLSMNKNVLKPGESATITAKVTNIEGEPVGGVNVTILTQETAGTITPYAITNNKGIATFEYTAPINITNMNKVDIVKAKLNVPDTILPPLQTATLFVPIQTTGSSWYKVVITDVSSYGLVAGQSAKITAKLIGANGNPVPKHEVYIQALYSTATDPNWYGEKAINDTNNVTFDATHKTTNAQGLVTFTMTANANVNRPYIVRVYTKDTYTAFDSVEIYVGNQTGSDPYIGAWTNNYGMNLEVTPTSVSNGGQQVSVTVKVYNTDGTPAADVSGYFGLFFTDYGAGAAWPNDANRTYFWWAGDYYAFTTNANGKATVIATTNPLIADQPVYVDAWVDPGIGGGIWLGAGFQYPYLFGVKEGFILERAPIMGITSFSVNKEYLSEMDTTTTVNFTVADINGPLSGTTLNVKYSVGQYSNTVSLTTDSNGAASFALSIPAQDADSVVTISVLMSSPDHAMGLNYEYHIAYIQGAELLKHAVAVDSITVNPDYVNAKGTATVKIKLVGGITGAPLAGKTVVASVSGGSLDVSSKTTDSNGVVTFTYTAPNALVSQHYTGVITVGEYSYAFGVSVKGQYATTGDVLNELNKIPVLQSKLQNLENNYTNLQSEHQKLQKDYKNMEDQKNSATTMEYVFLALFIIFLILTPVAYIAGKKKAPSVPEEGAEEETPEEPEDIMEEEKEGTEESSEEESTEEEKEE